MSHLGSRLSALVDGQLGPQESERILAHVATCEQCAAELAAARDARATLLHSADIQPEPELTQRLLALGRPPVEPRTAAPVGAASMPMPGSRIEAALPGDMNVPRRRFPVLVGALGVAFLAVLLTLGHEPQVVMGERPGDVLATLARAAPADGAPAIPSTEINAWVSAHPWATAIVVPDGHTVLGVHAQDTRIEVDMVGPDGLVVLTEERGVLTGEGELTQVDGRWVQLVARSPLCLAWQSGDAVVTVSTEGPSWAAMPLVAAYPDHAYDGGAPAQLGRGWQVLMTTWRSP